MSRTQVIDESERKRLSALIAQYNGNLTKIATALGLNSRQSLARKIAKYELDGEADIARALAGVKGPRNSLVVNGILDPEANRIAIIDSLARGGIQRAVVDMGISVRTVARRIHQLKISRKAVAKRRAEIASSAP